MVELEDSKIKLASKQIVKKIKVGNDKRQFILRIPTKISDNSILKNFEDKYTGELILNRFEKNKIVVVLKKDDTKTKSV